MMVAIRSFCSWIFSDFFIFLQVVLVVRGNMWKLLLKIVTNWRGGWQETLRLMMQWDKAGHHWFGQACIGGLRSLLNLLLLIAVD